MMRDGMKLGDQVFIYHSSCKDVGVVGIAEVVKEAIPTISSLTLKATTSTLKARRKIRAGSW